ncbi:hypothetical protein M409DRAFT_71197 [Zasmidium cellare ATCC 36951]|uniref:Uncharacterized protein n=1 Tax=Zasmidium cellare ATCC 36951 TaxID=1080233 RepID=A0A6A6C058_ZASCE|nr:uncharacterized protein M409DRAFT_71197 [Zasmidium cellare ATCC 36951]KAF2159199.1 hypothetical protein M409DRAFT_71197 [Zasmidium cellare ATCC 36951]
MATRIQTFRTLLPDLTTSLTQFQQSPSKFRILKTLTSTSSSSPNDPTPPKPSSSDSPKTLFILDSSFNPPSIAHKTLALSVLEKPYTAKSPSPHRLLLLFAVMNADKAPSPAAFEQRLAMMTVFARDLLDTVEDSTTDPEYIPVPIDIGVTKAPYYTDKSAAIEDEGTEWYPDRPKHVHLVGFDTLTRLFNAKYYQKFDPPFSALESYFGKRHRFRVTMRPDDEYGSVEDQESFVRKLAGGGMEGDGAKREWAGLVELVPPNPEAGVSSTKIRRAAKEGDWETVGSLCTPGVTEWVRRERLYEEDDRGAKMA